MKTTNLLEINKDRFYTASEVMRMNILPWKSTKSFHTYLSENSEWAELLKPVITTSTKNKRYFIKGENLLVMLEKMEKGEI